MRKAFYALLVVCAILSLPAVSTLTGCVRTEQRKAVNTIASVGYTVDAALKGYMDLVVAGKVPTNSVPNVTKSYGLFQVAYNTALTLAVMNTNAPVSVDLNNAASQTLLTIKAAKE